MVMWMPVRRTHTRVQSVLLQPLAVDRVQDTCGVIGSIGKTLENSEKNSPLLQLKSIQNVAPIPLFTPDSSSLDEGWSRKVNTSDGPDSRSTFFWVKRG
jgi:hypothetical protein